MVFSADICVNIFIITGLKKFKTREEEDFVCNFLFCCIMLSLIRLELLDVQSSSYSVYPGLDLNFSNSKNLSHLLSLYFVLYGNSICTVFSCF